MVKSTQIKALKSLDGFSTNWTLIFNDLYLNWKNNVKFKDRQTLLAVFNNCIYILHIYSFSLKVGYIYLNMRYPYQIYIYNRSFLFYIV